MKRRSFLQLLGAAPAVAIAPKLIGGNTPTKFVHKELSSTVTFHDGLGLAQTKPEGQSIRYDAVWNEKAWNKWYWERYNV